MSDSHLELQTRAHYSEYGINKGKSEPWHLSINGVSLRGYTEFRPGFWPNEPQTDAEVDAAAEKLAKALQFSTDPAFISDEEKAFYTEKFFKPTRADDFHPAVGYAVLDWAINSGNKGALNDIRSLCRLNPPLIPYHMDDSLFDRLTSRPPWLVVNALCDGRWAFMQMAEDFFHPSRIPGHIIGEGRAKRMSDVHRGAMELLGHPPEPNRYDAKSGSA